MQVLAFFISVFAWGGATNPAVVGPGPDSAAWRALLHFEGSQSHAAPGAPFFLSPTGHEDAAAEWEATRALLREDPQGACRFPARAIFFGLEPTGYGPLCERWERWRQAIDARGVELVFASAFLNSPSSMYGHTLLKFPRGDRSTEKEELLDYTLNYGAETGQSGGAGYVWHGLTGKFPGYFSTAPFYLKVREYNHVENRDFWVYELNATPAELARLVAHAWELRDVKFPYYFLRRNCSYYLLEFLEVARPGQGLTDAFPLWAVPMDTIRRLERHGWLGARRLRPSREKILLARRAALNPAEVKEVPRLLEENARFGGQSAALLDTAYDLWRYRTEGKELRPGDREKEQALLRARVGALGTSVRPTFTETPPEKGHGTNRLSLAYGRSSRGAFGELAYRAALHDLLANPLGYEPHSELTMGDIRARWQSDRLFLERFDLLRIRSVAPVDPWFSRIAWSFRLGAARAKEMGCEAWRCTFGYAAGGAGFAKRIGPFLGFALAELDVEAGGVFTPDYRLASGPTIGLFTPLWPGARLLAEGEWRWRLLGEKRQKRLARLGLAQDLGRGLELRAEGEKAREFWEMGLKGGWYF